MPIPMIRPDPAIHALVKHAKDFSTPVLLMLIAFFIWYHSQINMAPHMDESNELQREGFAQLQRETLEMRREIVGQMAIQSEAIKVIAMAIENSSKANEQMVTAMLKTTDGATPSLYPVAEIRGRLERIERGNERMERSIQSLLKQSREGTK